MSSIHDTIDWLGALRTCLLASSYITDQVGASGVYVGQIPRGADPPGKVIVLVQTGGTSEIRLPLVDVAVQARCYGDDSIEAMQVYRGLRSALHGTKRQKIDPGVGVGSGTNWMLVAREASLPSQEREPVTEWYFVLAQFMCLFVTFPVS